MEPTRVITPDKQAIEDAGKMKNMFDMLKNKQAPAVIGQPIFQKCIDDVKRLGYNTPALWFGKRVRDDDLITTAVPVNYGSKSACKGLPEESRLMLFGFKKALSNVEIQACYKGRTNNPSKELMESVPLYKTQLVPFMKAFNVTDFSTWIDTVQARFFFEEYEEPYILADTFDSMPMSSPIVRAPGALGLLEGELEADDGTFTVQTNTQASYLVESKNNVVHTNVTQDLLDDSAPAIIEKIRREVMKGGVRSYERAILDGDDSGAHIDDDTQAGSAKLFTKAFDGLRQRAFANEVTVGGNAIVYDHGGVDPDKDLWAKLLTRLKCQGAEKADLCYIYGCDVSHKLVTGAIPELFTAFAFGGLASNVTGMVPPVFGIKGVESQLVREDLEADGKADNPTVSTTTYMLLVQKSRFSNWIRQATRVFASPSLPSSDFMLMTGKTRHAFAGIPQTAVERSVIMGINIKTI